jgi:hypothetical protein
MYGGLRVGEACAVTPEKLSGDYLEVNEAYSQDGLMKKEITGKIQ